MTAARYNSLRYNIGLYYGFNEVPSGELIDLDYSLLEIIMLQDELCEKYSIRKGDKEEEDT